MKKINIRRIYYHIRHRFLTMNNIVIAVAFMIGASWAWGSIGMMQRNYDLQKEVDTKTRNLKLAELQTQNLAYEQRYYQSGEYQELEVRKRLGLAAPGESVLILPPNSQQAKSADVVAVKKSVKLAVPASDFQQWMNFLFGGNRQNLQK
jgi:cell division protein FtsB